MDEADEIAFVRILRETFPEVRFSEDNRYTTPDIPVERWIPEGAHDASVFVPDQENWSPLVLSHPTLKGEFYLHLPRRHFTFDRSQWTWMMGDHKWAFDSPTIDPGSIHGAYRREGGEDERVFLNTVWRLLGKITVNLGSFWAGYSALRWAAKKPRRMISGCARPPEDWSFPEDCPYYRDELWDDDPPKDSKLHYFGAVPPNAKTDDD